MKDPNDEGHRWHGTPQETNETKHADSAASLPGFASESDARAAIEAQDKRFKTLQARAALKGFEVHFLSAPGGGSELIAARWGYARRLATVDALEAWLDRAGVEP